MKIPFIHHHLLGWRGYNPRREKKQESKPMTRREIIKEWFEQNNYSFKTDPKEEGGRLTEGDGPERKRRIAA